LSRAALLLLALAAPAQADDPDPPPGRTINLVVYGEDPCPQSTGEEIVVCARRPESERYRIPKSLRNRDQRGEASWGSRSEALDEASRPSMPGSCSVVGSYGQSGCFQQMMNQWFKERRSRR
jgi:hypothetical protein